MSRRGKNSSAAKLFDCQFAPSYPSMILNLALCECSDYGRLTNCLATPKGFAGVIFPSGFLKNDQTESKGAYIAQ